MDFVDWASLIGSGKWHMKMAKILSSQEDKTFHMTGKSLVARCEEDRKINQIVRASQKCYCSPKLKILGQTRQIPKLYAKKVTQNFSQNFFSTFSFASKHLKFYYIAQYSRSRSNYFESQCIHFWLEFIDDSCIY